MRFVSDDKVRYLGCRKSKNDNGEFFSINVCDAEGQAMRFYCTEQCFDHLKEDAAEFGNELLLELDIAYFNNRFSVRVQDATKV